MTHLRDFLVPAAITSIVGCTPGDARDAHDTGGVSRDSTARAVVVAPAPTPAAPAAPDSRMTDDSLALTLDVPPSVRRGTAVPFTFRVANRSAAPVTLYLRGRTIAFDVTITDAGGGVVWRRLEDEAIEGILQLRELAVGETLTLRATWDQRTARGAAVDAGEYRAQAELLTDGAPLASAPATFRIAPR